MITPIFQWVKKNKAILFNTGSLIGTMVVTSLLGFAYWWVAARLFRPEAVGLASAATSTMMLISSFCMMGLGTLLITEIPRNKGNEGPLISTALLLVGGVGFVAGTTFALLAPFISPALRPIGADIQNIVLFGASISITVITIVIDQAVIGLLQGGLQFWRNTIFSIVKLIALYLLAIWLNDKIGMSIYATWTLGNIFSLIPLIFLAIWKNRTRLGSLLPRWYVLRKLGGAAIQHHILNLILQAPTQVLPVLVTVLLSPAMNAWFYVSSMLANFVFSIAASLTTVLHATNAAQTTTLSQKTRLTVGISALTGVVTSGILVLAANLVLSFFGHSYAANAAWPLRILALAAFPLIIKNHHIAIRRIKDEITNSMLPIILGSILELVLATLGAGLGGGSGLSHEWMVALVTHLRELSGLNLGLLITLGARLGGLTGLSLGWVAALSVEATFMAPLVFKTIRGTDTVANTISSVVDADTMILRAIRPQTITDSLGNFIDTPTQQLATIMGLDSPTDTIKTLTFIDAPTIKMNRIQIEEQHTIRLPKIEKQRPPVTPRRYVVPDTPAPLARSIKRPKLEPITMGMRALKIIRTPSSNDEGPNQVEQEHIANQAFSRNRNDEY
ncbi:lipopolysaccharide biosynthesis protein [Ktedonobacter robiniae]|uniref:lipopolysaccharide biosynthesis protein n=1 Tax=Ktedonobacter robiniae TaxID=2778365 RepID=UPI00191662AD|nr:oligosaccharide flippase family protein [Ktedonobacter robiniae]